MTFINREIKAQYIEIDSENKKSEENLSYDKIYIKTV